MSLYLILIPSLRAQEGALVFDDVQKALDYGEQKCRSLKISHTQYLLARYEELIAEVEIFNPKAIVSGSAINNLELPVSFLPGEVFGEPGAAQAVELGQQYVSMVTVTPQIDIINIPAWNKLRSASHSRQLAETNEQIAKKSLFESIASSYFNIVALQQQIDILHHSRHNSDSILIILMNKYEQGLIRKQEVNKAKINMLLIKDKLVQYECNLRQQQNAFRVLCDIDHDVVLKFKNDRSFNDKSVVAIQNNLYTRQKLLEHEIALQDYKAAVNNLWPVLSAVGGWAWQDNSNVGFFDSNGSSFQSSYIGLRLTYNIPTAGFFRQSKKTKANLNIAKLNLDHARLQQNTDHENLLIDYQKAISAVEISAEVLELKNDSYARDSAIFYEGILPADDLLNILNDLINAQLNHVASQSNARYLMTKVNINNNLQ